MADMDPEVGREDIDLTNCDREPIHIPGRIQSFGALISISADWIVNHASTNVEEFLGIGATQLIGRPAADFLSAGAEHEIRTRLQMLNAADAVERLFGIQLIEKSTLFDVAVHLSGRSIVMEIERHRGDRNSDYVFHIRPTIDRIRRADTIEALCNVAARQLKAITGFDRVMVYRFAPDDSGEVVAEALQPDMEGFKGLHFPASDIPKQARVMYTRNLLRIICDANDSGVPIEPVLNPEGEPLDLTMSTTRAVSPIHLEYLRNMGVAASMSVSIIRRGKLWGLFACHHSTPKILSYEARTAAELFGQLFAFVLDQKESDLEREEAGRAQVLHDEIMAQLAEGSTIGENFDMIADAVGSVIQHDGVVGWIKGQFQSRGLTPTQDEFPPLLQFLNTAAASKIYATDSLVKLFPPASDYAERAAGILVLPVSRVPGDYVVLFRQEIARSVNWAGNPEKPVEVGDSGARLTPRKSFEAWQEVVRHHSAPWTPGQVRAAESLRMTLFEVVLRLTDATLQERGKAQERQELLIAELNHRVRNILNLIRSLVSQSRRDATDITEFTNVIGGRIHALARAHDQITQENWSPASVRELINTEAAAYLGDNAGRVKLSGPDALLEPTAFTTLCLVIHEMITNSAKYGALFNPHGSIDISLREEPDGALRIDWSEQGGPPVRAPTRHGFGTTIIDRSIPFELHGSADIRFEVPGVQASFSIPPEYVAGFRSSGDGRDEQRTAIEDHRPLAGAALVVEDNMIIALDAEEFLSELGANKVVVAGNVTQALSALAKRDFAFGLLDVNLGSETSERVAQTMVDKGVPFAFATGYGEITVLSEKYPDAPVVRKPYAKDSLGAAIARLN